MGCSSSSPSNVSAPIEVPPSNSPDTTSQRSSLPVIVEAEVVNSTNRPSESLPVCAKATLVDSNSPTSLPTEQDDASPTSYHSPPPPPPGVERETGSLKKKTKPLPNVKKQIIDPDALTATSWFSILFLVMDEDEEDDEESDIPHIIHVLHSDKIENFISLQENDIKISSLKHIRPESSSVSLSPALKTLISPSSSHISLKCFTFIISEEEYLNYKRDSSSSPPHDLCLKILSHFHDHYGLKIRIPKKSKEEFFSII